MSPGHAGTFYFLLVYLPYRAMSIERIATSAIVIGAGPAGAGTSFFLSKFGIPHIVVEKEYFPRDKVCGDACSGKTVLVLNRANPEWMKEIQNTEQDFLPAWGISFVAPNGKVLEIPFEPNRTKESKPPGFTTPRLVFDNFLFQKMASPFCKIYQGAKIEDIKNENGKAIVTILHEGKQCQIVSPMLVGADGDKSIVRRKYQKGDNSPKAYSVGLRAYYEGVSGLHAENFIELHFLPEIQPGYLWIFPLPNGMTNVGVGILSETVRKKKINLREQMLFAIRNNPAIAPRFANATLNGKIQGWGLPLAVERQSMSGDNYILTGDAAALIDPFTGEGIGNALYSGMLAAEAIQKCISGNNYSGDFLKEQYDDVVYKRLGDELKISTTLQRLSCHRWLFNAVVNKAYKSVSLRNTISCMFSDIDLRDKLRKPSFYFKILFNR